MQKRLIRIPYLEILATYPRNSIRKFSKELLLFFSLLVISLLFLYILCHSIIPEKRNFIDNNVFNFFQPFISKDNTRIARFITFFGTGSFLIPAYIFIIFYLVRKNYIKYSIMVSTLVVSSLLLGWLLKPLFHRTRPPYHLVVGAGGFSFPSGHALGGFIFSGVIIFIVWRIQKKFYMKCILSILITLFGVLIGLSRIYLHVHYATDIVGSLFISLAWFSLCYILFCIIFKNKLHEKREFGNKEPEMASQESGFSF